MNDLSVNFTVNATPQEVYDAINNVKGWWHAGMTGRSNKVGASFKYRYKDLHRSTQKVTKLVPGKKVVWHVTDSIITFIEDKKEWNGTDVIFDIVKKGTKTELRFKHKGIVPACECYKACKGGWGYYVGNSLKKLITTGKGLPEPKAKPKVKRAS